MENNETNSKKWKRLDTISFRGERKVWLRFLSVVKRKGKKNAWEILGSLILNYLEMEGEK